MPKATSQRTARKAIMAKDYINGGFVRMNNTVSHSFDQVGQNHRYIHVPIPPVKVRELTLEERLELQKEAEAEAAERSLLHRLTIERQKLVDRITDAPPPLHERLSEPGPSRPDYQPPAPIPNKIHFIQTKKLKRLEDLKVVLGAIRENLDPVFEILKEDEDREKLHGIRSLVSEEIRDNLWGWYNEVQEIGLRETEEWRKLTNKQWRNLFGALKKIKKVSCKNPKERFRDICLELRHLNIEIPRIN